MKRFGNIYEKITTMENLRGAHRNARKDKASYQEVQMVDENPDYYLGQIQKMLIENSYEVSKYKIKTICDKGKERKLMKLPYYPDRIIQWAIMLQIEDIFLSTFTTFTCASIKNRGIRRASHLVTKYLKEDVDYCLKFDISKFYDNVDRDILKKLLRKKLKDQQLLSLLDKIIDSPPGEKGIPIGSYLSQYLANYYLSYFDHFLKEELGIKYVVRYMDDIVILHKDKVQLHLLKNIIENYLKLSLNLDLKSNWQVFPIEKRGVDFVGYRHFKKYKLLRKNTSKRLKKSLTKISKKNHITHHDFSVFYSYKGLIKFCNSYNLLKRFILPLQLRMNIFYNTNIKRGGNENETNGNCIRFQRTSERTHNWQRYCLCA